MSNVRSAWGGRCAVAAGLVSVAGLATPAIAEIPLNFRVENSVHPFTPLHSASTGESGHYVFFVGGLSGQGMHHRAQVPGQGIGFPQSVYSQSVHMYDLETDTLYSGGIAHLPASLRETLTYTNAGYCEYADTLYIYGGYGPTNDATDWYTRGTVTAVDLAQIRTALLAADPIPAGAFNVQFGGISPVTGQRMAKMGNKFVHVGGFSATGDYGRTATANFFENYPIEFHQFDAGTSFTIPELTFFQTNPIPSADRLRKRDMNAFPAMLPLSGGGLGAGVAILGGVFRQGFFVFEHPMTYAPGDADITEHTDVTIHMSQYEAPSASFYSVEGDENRFVTFSGMSSHTWTGAAFVPVGGGGFAIPWSREISDVRMVNGQFVNEYVRGLFPLPTVNAELILDELLPRLANDQIALDDVPPAEIPLGRVFGGLRAAAIGQTPATFASGGIYDIFMVYGVRGDVTRDGVVNSTDLGQMLGAWGVGGGRYDLNQDGVVNSADLALLLGSWGNSTPG